MSPLSSLQGGFLGGILLLVVATTAAADPAGPDLAQDVLSNPLQQADQLPIITTNSSSHSNCRFIPGDADWPSPSLWAQLNQTVHGRLIATVPLAAVCYPPDRTQFRDSDGNPLYSEEKCAKLREDWHLTATHYRDPASMMRQFFVRGPGPDGEEGCNAFVVDGPAKCSIGGHVVYTVNATNSASDFISTMAFAHENNIRLVIRNTGHDFLGKSTGFGALALWTHHLKDISFLDFDNTQEAEQNGYAPYKGKAAKLGAGVQVSDAFSAAKDHGLVLLGGVCESVGVVGGYTQGGGHSVLASAMGMGADQVLEWEVVIPPSPATGHPKPRLVTATPFNEYADLYWALSGGGGGTFGAVVSVTVKAWEDFEAAGATLMFSSAGLEDRKTFLKGVQAWLEGLPRIVDVGAGVFWWLMKDKLAVSPLMAPRIKAEELKDAFRPVLERLDELGISYTSSFTDFPSFHDAVAALFFKQNVTDANMGGRLIPRSLVTDTENSGKLTEALDAIISAGVIFSGTSANIERGRKLSEAYPNSVNPLLESAIAIGVFGTYYDHLNFSANLNAQDKITNLAGATLKKLTPGGGAYLNEADPRQPDWQDTFYGENYERLLAIKNKYDPEGLLYALTAVGSEQWAQKEDGRICLV